MTKPVTRSPRDRRWRFPELIDRIADGLFLVDATGRFIDVNQAACESLRYKREELLSLSVADVAEEAASRLAEALDGVTQAEAVIVDATHVRKDGTTFPVQLNISAVEFDGERCLLAVARDMSTIVRAEEKLRASEERLKILFESAPDGVYLNDLSGKFVDGNAAAEELTGYKRDELIGKSFLELELLPAEQIPKAAEVLARNVSGQPTGPDEFTLNRKGGGQVTVEIRTFPVTIEGETRVLGIARDVSERKKAEEALREARDELETRVEERTADLSATNERLRAEIGVRREAEKALRESEARYRSLFIDTPSALHTIDREGRLVEVSDHWLELLGYEREEVIGRQSMEFLTEGSRRYAETTALPDFWKTGRARNVSYEFRRKNGEIVETLLNGIAKRNEEGEFATSVASLTDVTERNRAEKELRRSEERNRALLTAMPDMMFILNSDGVYLDYHSSVTDDFNLSPDEFLGKTVREVMPPDLAEQTMDTLGSVIEKQTASTFEYQLAIRGKTLDFEARYVPHGDDQALAVVRNITDRKKAEATIEHMAYHDSLTGLPNRELLKDHLELAIAQARRSGRRVAVMFLDVDRFKVINDTLGHPAGDKLLQRIADQLTRVVRDGDTVARVGGDEFILLLPDLVEHDDARVVAERALGRVRRKRRLAGRELVVTASLGISVYPSDGDDAETLLSHADTAMYKAKEQGRNQFEFYNLAMGAKLLARLELDGDLRRAVAQDEFVLHYQPQIAIDSGEIVGIEALIRWQHPNKGLLLPNEFIGVAQDSGLMSRLDEQTLRAASAQCVAWQRSHSHSLRLSVNFGTNALLDRGLPRMVESILRSSGLAPASLVVEITEQHAVQDIPSTQRALRELKTIGVQIAADDFGTGHSSLAYLSQFPIDVVKIDRAFVGGIGRTPENSAIVVAIVSMARGLGLKVIAEGVETEEQLAFLKDLRCDEFQGYLFSRPVPPQEFERLLSASDLRQFR